MCNECEVLLNRISAQDSHWSWPCRAHPEQISSAVPTRCRPALQSLKLLNSDLINLFSTCLCKKAWSHCHVFLRETGRGDRERSCEWSPTGITTLVWLIDKLWRIMTQLNKSIRTLIVLIAWPGLCSYNDLLSSHLHGSRREVEPLHCHKLCNWLSYSIASKSIKKLFWSVKPSTEPKMQKTSRRWSTIAVYCCPSSARSYLQSAVTFESGHLPLLHHFLQHLSSYLPVHLAKEK